MDIGRLNVVKKIDNPQFPGLISNIEEEFVPHRNWFAIWVAARHEKVVSRLLVNKGFETFLPLYKRRHRYAERVREFDLPLFPGYLFCRTDLSARLPILTTPGVLQMIGSGREPIPVEDREIASLQKAAESAICLTPHPYPRSGQVARIISGPLVGIEGVVVNAKDLSTGPMMRIVLSVNLLRRSVLLEIECDRVVLLPDQTGSVA